MSGGGYGGNFDLDPYGIGGTNGYYDPQTNPTSTQNRYQQAQQQAQQQLPMNPCYNRYDPSISTAPATNLVGDPYSSYNSTSNHIMLQPAAPSTAIAPQPPSTATTTPADHYQQQQQQQHHHHPHHHRSNTNNNTRQHQQQHTSQAPRPFEISFEPDPIANSVEARHHQGGTSTTSTTTNRCAEWPGVGNGGIESDAMFFQDTLDDLARSIAPPLQQQASSQVHGGRRRSTNKRKQQTLSPSLPLSSIPQRPPLPNPDAWLDQISLEVSGVSLEPLKGTQVVQKIRSATDDVITRYLPCVDFLVACQQELRAGLATATRKRIVRGAYRDTLTPRQFYNQYLQPLPDRFICKNQNLMDQSHLRTAVKEIQKLCGDSRKVEYQGCEAMKNSFLGGMKEGVSWGLRKWLSKNGGALTICNDLECILSSVQKMDRSHDNTKRMGERLRPLAKQAFDRLKRDVPASYQEQSTAHPYLPFFHRLECALKGISNFDPEDDDVICIDDEDEIEEVKASAAVAAATKKKEDKKDTKRKAASKPKKSSRSSSKRSSKRSKPNQDDNTTTTRTNGEIEILDFDGGGDNQEETTATETTRAAGGGAAALEPNEDATTTKIELKCARCTMTNPAGSPRCCMCDQDFSLSENYEIQEMDGSDHFNIADVTFDDASSSILETSNHQEDWEPPRNTNNNTTLEATNDTNNNNNNNSDASELNGIDMAQRMESLAYMFDSNKQDKLTRIL